MEVYLDNAATTQCSQAVQELVVKTMMQDYGNPSSLHAKGLDAERCIRTAKERISKILKVADKELFFTSGGTESNNLAIIGTAMANCRRGKHLITTQLEHPSVLQPMKYLEEQGFEVTYLPSDRYGRVDLQALKEAVREDTVLVSIMHVNNEIGTVQPVAEAACIVKELNNRTYVHTDSVQGFGKLRIHPKRIGIDLLSASGHKIHGPKGVGLLYVSDRVRLRPILFGGGQQGDLRSGTENVPGIAGFAQAAADAYENLEEKMDKLHALRQYFVGRLQTLEDVSIHGCTDEGAAPHIVSAAFGGIRSEVMLHALEESQIYVSSGSACASNKKTASGTLTAVKATKEQMEGTIRFSFSAGTTKEQLDYCLEKLCGSLPVLRKFKRY